MHFTPAGFPPGIPGNGDEIDAAIQQAPQPGRHFIGYIKGDVFGAKINKTADLHYLSFRLDHQQPVLPAVALAKAGIQFYQP